MVLFTLLGLYAFLQRERKPVNSTHSGQNENVNQSDDVPPVERNGGQTYQDITIDPEVSTAVEPITSDLEVSTAVEPITSDLEVSTAVEPITSDPEVSTTVEPITSDPEVSTAVEPITSDPEVSTAVEPITSDPEVDDDCSDDDIFQDLDDINSFSGEICEGGFKIPLHDGLQEGYSEPIPLELQHMHSEDKKRLDNETRLDSGVPEVPADDAPEVLNNVFSGLSPQWKNWWVRGILTLAMISFFFMAIDLGPMALMMSVLCVQIKCFHEIITIGYSVYNCYHLPWFRTQSWYFLLCANYFFYGETFADYFFMLLQREEHIRMISKNHHFISFALYLAGFCMFVLSLVKKHYRLQFYMFGWTHVTLLIVATQSHLIIRNLFEGMIWFIMPISCVICNDTMAYVFGFFLGRTPLIKLSPKKTWEGFIGGFFSTVVVGVLLSYMMAGYSYFVCPVEFNIHSNSFTMDCEPSDLFQLQDYGLPSVLQSITGWTAVKLYPFQIHSIALSSFASVMGPFGGFFASGFKRAFQIKDFANTIPGHGGFMDRFDCQFLMATFVNVYIGSFIREPNPSKIIQQLLALRPDQQLYIFNSIKAHLTEKGLLPPLEDAANLYGQLSWRLLPW